MIVDMYDIVGDFGEDKDAASALRKKVIIEEVSEGNEVVLDFSRVTLVTQSFVHALISDVLRVNGEKSLDLLDFRNCTEVVRGIIATVVQYSLDTIDEPDFELDDPPFASKLSAAKPPPSPSGGA